MSARLLLALLLLLLVLVLVLLARKPWRAACRTKRNDRIASTMSILDTGLTRAAGLHKISIVL
jgi:type II secretory pathway component PulJ